MTSTAGPVLLLLSHREVASEGCNGCPIRVLGAADAAHDKIDGLDAPIGRAQFGPSVLAMVNSPCSDTLWTE